ncbi:MAG TPA: hypothetical protein VMR52_04350 [Dehalococcoidia bacterium]|nr:hypothetical protein [Dehalococcoidia bacterium]
MSRAVAGVEGVRGALERGDVEAARVQFLAVEPVLHEMAEDMETVNADDAEVLHDVIDVVKLKLDSSRRHDLPGLIETTTRMFAWFESASLVLAR